MPTAGYPNNNDEGTSLGWQLNGGNSSITLPERANWGAGINRFGAREVLGSWLKPRAITTPRTKPALLYLGWRWLRGE